MLASRSKTNQINEQQEPLLYSDTSYVQLADFPEVPTTYPTRKDYSGSNENEETQAFLQHNFSTPVIDVEKEPPTLGVDVERSQNYIQPINDDFFEQEFRLNIKDENLMKQESKNFQPVHFAPSAPLPQQVFPQQCETVVPNVENDLPFDISMLSFEEQMNIALQLSCNESQAKIQPNSLYIPEIQESKQYYGSSIEAIEYYSNLRLQETLNQNVQVPQRVQVSSNPHVDALSDIPMIEYNSAQNQHSFCLTQEPGVAYVYPTEESNARVVKCANCDQWLKVIKQATIVHCPTCRHRTSIVAPADRAQSDSLFSCFSKLFST